MSLNDVVIVQQSGGLGRRTPSEDGISGIVSNANNNLIEGFEHDVPYKLYSIEDAEALGITEESDTDNQQLLWYAIKQYFTANKQSAPLWLMLVKKYDDFDNVKQAISKLVIASDGQVKQIGVVTNNSFEDVTNEITNTGDISNVLAIEEILEELTRQHYPCIAIVEPSLCPDENSYPDLRALNCRRVSCMAGMDYKNAIREDFNAIKRGDVGTVLGTISLAKVHENIGWVQKFNLLGSMLRTPSAYGTKLSDAPLSIVELYNDRGYLFFRTHVNKAGIYLNDSHTCTELTDDFAYIENNRTIDKATRLIRAAFLPYLNSPVYVDPNTGNLAPNVVAMLESVGAKTITDEMLSAGEISGFTFTIDPAQDILATSQLEAVLSITPVGTARQILIKIGFNNPFNS